MKWDIDVDGAQRVGPALEEGLENGIEEAGNWLLDRGVRRAKDQVRATDRVWREGVYRGFKKDEQSSGSTHFEGQISNVAPHARIVERGLKPGEANPSVQDILPWVSDKLAPAPYGNFTGGPGSGSGIRYNENGVPLDEDGNYVRENNFVKHGPDSVPEKDSLFVGERAIVYDSIDDEYVRGRISKVELGRGNRVEFFEAELRAGGINPTVRGFAENTDRWRLVANEDPNELADSEVESLVKEWWRRDVVEGYDNLINGTSNESQFAEIDATTERFLRDELLSDVRPTYRSNRKYLATIRQLKFLATVTKENKKNDIVGQAVTFSKGGSGLVIRSVENRPDSYRKKLKRTLHHEFAHLSSTARQADPNTNTQIRAESWGDEYEYGPLGAKLFEAQTADARPDFITEFFHRDADGDTLAGQDWLPDAYDAGTGSLTDFKNYQPDLNTPESQPFKRFFEATNHAWWLKVTRQQDPVHSFNPSAGDIEDYPEWVAGRSYGLSNPEEQHATTVGILSNGERFEEIIERMDEYTPWLLETYTNAYNPTGKTREILDNLGYDI